MQQLPQWIDQPLPGRLATMPRPGNGDFLRIDLETLAVTGVQVIVSALTDEEMQWHDLVNEPALCREMGICWLSFPIPDRACPPADDRFTAFCRDLLHRLEDGQAIMVHCFAGVGRATLIAASTLILAGLTAAQALERISQARGIVVPDTREQLQFLQAFEASHGPAAGG